MNKLNFKNLEYKEKALTSKAMQTSSRSFIDAFFLLIKDISMEDLSNLCIMIQQYYKNLPTPIELTLENCYKLTQQNNLDDIEKITIVNLASQCIKNGRYLGNKTINDGKISTSAWINHCFYASEVCANLAEQLGLDLNTAKTIGLLHDYGRKFNHSFMHTIDGFEALINLNWENEAIGCLTHSFINNGRCSNNEPAVEGFYVDKDGNPKWNENVEKDDITLFLENYQYSNYDVILNIADLMATSEGIVSPKKRLEDIATRRTIDPTNRGYFLADLTNTLIDILKKLNLIDENSNYIKANENTPLSVIENYFNQISDHFFNAFLNFENIKKQNKV